MRLDLWARAHPALALFALAFALRLAVGLALNEGLRDGVLYHPDSQFYMDRAGDLRAQWDAGDRALPDYPRFAIVVAAASYLGGDGYLGAWTATLLVGAAAAPLASACLRNAGLPQAAPWAGAFIALEPTGLYYSTQLLRDAWFVSAALVMAWAALAKARPIWRLACALAGVAVFEALNRPSEGRVVAGLLAVALVVSAAMQASRHRARTFALFLVLGSALFLAACPLLDLDERGSAGAPASHVRFFPDPTPDLRTGTCLGTLLALLPSSLIALVYPLPWTARNGVEIAFAGAMVAIYTVIAAGAWAWWAKARRPGLGAAEWRVLLLMGIPALGVLAYLGLGIHVVGPLIRWRLVAIAMLLIAWAAPMPAWWSRLRAVGPP